MAQYTTAQAQQIVGEYDNIATTLARSAARLDSLAPIVSRMPASVQSKYARLVNDTRQVRARWATFKAARDAVANHLRQVGVGLRNVAAGTVAWINSYLPDNLKITGLGAVPAAALVVGALVGGALVASAMMIISNNDAFERNLKVSGQLVSSGVPLADAVEITQQMRDVSKSGNTSLFGNVFGSTGQWILGAIVIVTLGPPIINAIAGRRD